MRAVVLVAGLLVAGLSVTKLHLNRTTDGQLETRVVLQQPFSMPIDSTNAYCLRRLDQPIFKCAMAFADQRDSALKIASLPFCRGCADLSGWLSTLGKDPAAVAKRRADFETIAGMAFGRP